MMGRKKLLEKRFEEGLSKQEERFNREREKNEEENKRWSGRGGEN